VSIVKVDGAGLGFAPFFNGSPIPRRVLEMIDVEALQQALL